MADGAVRFVTDSIEAVTRATQWCSLAVQRPTTTSPEHEALMDYGEPWDREQLKKRSIPTSNVEIVEINVASG